MPNEEVELIRNDAHYRRDYEGIAKRTGITKFTMLLIGTVTVVFEVGTVWMSWKPLANN